VQLHRAVDQGKDQSYVLGVLNQDQLQRSYFPLGGSLKTEVRAEAERRGLSVADKPDSHDICFIADGDTAGFLDKHLGARPGAIVDEDGQRLGEHDGSHHFTIGQRKGLRIGTPAEDGKPRYVLDISPVTNTVTVGSRDGLAVRRVEAIRPTWTEGVRDGSWRAAVQVRAHGSTVPATVTAGVDVDLDEPLTGVAPGQTVVYYDGTRVVGSATISAAHA
jgi:tRNA-specific 2-thiouridylase